MLSAALFLTLSAAQASVEMTLAQNGGTTTKIKLNGVSVLVFLADFSTGGSLTASKDQIGNLSRGQ